ncbi:MAG: N-formylglutamate amidohydrolase [Pseudomonadota bacterium]|nr:N-formylglutamate amidohydrolase [Pseudomonadota bacterium]
MFDPMTLRPTVDVEPPAFHILNPAGRARALFVCDHASNALPRDYGTLGIAPEKMFDHIAWDVGAAAVTRRLSARFDATAVLGGASRLFVDLNREPDDPSAIPEFSDGTVVPGNKDLSEGERAWRFAWHRHYHNEIERQVLRHEVDGVPAMIYIHSFTPVIRGQARPWHLGVLHDGESAESLRLMEVLRADTSLVVGDNQPYSIDKPMSHSVYRHAIRPGRPYVIIEIRQDLIQTETGAETWAEIVGDAFAEVFAPLRAFPAEAA